MDTKMDTLHIQVAVTNGDDVSPNNDSEDEVFFSARSNFNCLRDSKPDSSKNSRINSSPDCESISTNNSLSVDIPAYYSNVHSKFVIQSYPSCESDPGKPITPLPFYVFSFDPQRKLKEIEMLDHQPSAYGPGDNWEGGSEVAYASICDLIGSQIQCDSDDSLDSWGTHWDSDSEDPGSGSEYEVQSDVRKSQIQLTPEEKAAKHCHLVAGEILSTEVEYTRRLNILTQAHRQWSGVIPTDKLALVFRHLPPIVHHHRDELLPDLTQRLNQWSSTPRIGDIFKLHTPHFKMYTEYITGLQDATELVQEWEANTAYMGHIHHLQVEMRKLKLSHLLKEPFPRIPRYRLLLEQYLKYLPVDSDDRQDVEAALNEIHKVMEHFQQNMDNKVNCEEMARLRKKMKDSIVLPAASRHFVREGLVKVISARSNKGTEHTLLLFSDLLLVCRKTINGYRVRYKFNLQRSKVLEKGSREDTFYLKGRKFCIEVGVKNVQEREEWEKEIRELVKKRSKDCCKRLTWESGTLLDDDDDIRHLATMAPILRHFRTSSTCRGCGETFLPLLRRKYHCKCCGQVVCRTCAPHKRRLAYNPYKERTVCNACFVHLADDEMESAGKLETTWDEVSCSQDGVLEIRKGDNAVWQKRYCCILSNHRLYYISGPNKAVHVPLKNHLEILKIAEPSGERPCMSIPTRSSTLFISLEQRRAGAKHSHGDEVKLFDGWTQWALALQKAAEESIRNQQKTSLSRLSSHRALSSSSSSDISNSRPISCDEGFGSFECSVESADDIQNPTPVTPLESPFTRQMSQTSDKIEIVRYYGCLNKDTSVADIKRKFENRNS